jgi:hypothetical protein
MLDGVELGEASEDDDGTWFSVIASSAAEPWLRPSFSFSPPSSAIRDSKPAGTPIQRKEGQPDRLDYEYAQWNGQSLHDVRAARRLAPCQSHRSAVDYAHALTDLADIHFLNANPHQGFAL